MNDVESLRLEVANLRGVCAVLERLIMETVTKQIIEVRVQAHNAEAIAGRSFEQIQGFINQMQSEGVMPDEYGEAGVVDVRSGGIAQRAQKKDVNEPS